MSFKLYKRGDKWHMSGTIAGRRIRRATGATGKAEAQSVAARIWKDEWDRHQLGAEAVLTMAQAMMAYLDAGKSKRFLAPIAGHWKDTRVKSITGEAIRQSAKKLYPAASAATWNRQVIVPTQAVINFAAKMGWCSKIEVERFRTDPKRKTPASLEWVKAFAAQAMRDGLPHLAAMCIFMFGTGARRGEAARLSWADVDLSKRLATVRQTKTQHTRAAHLPPEVIAALANIPSNRNPDELVFGYSGPESVNKVWTNVAKRAGIELLSPHCCRHGFATTMLQKGIDPATIAERGGWKTVAIVLSTYAHASKDRTVTDVLFDTKSAQGVSPHTVTSEKKRRKSQ
jgi:integrase